MYIRSVFSFIQNPNIVIMTGPLDNYFVATIV